jgi:hypothetical protein
MSWTITISLLKKLLVVFNVQAVLFSPCGGSMEIGCAPSAGVRIRKLICPLYFLLISPAISNKQARAFLHLASEDTASRLLSVMPSSGTKKRQNLPSSIKKRPPAGRRFSLLL